MSDFEYIQWILSESYLCREPNHRTMTEDKGDEHRPQKISVRLPDANTPFALYRFDLESDNGDFIPFFNNSGNAPSRLKAFCDYIALVEFHERLVVFLVELKRGDTAGHQDQLEAAYEFMQYVLRSAERIGSVNGMPGFDRNNVEFRRVLVKRSASNKRITKPKDVRETNRNEVIDYICDRHFVLRDFLR